MMPGNSAGKLARGNREYPCIFHNLRIFLKGVHLLDERVEGCLVLYLYPFLILSFTQCPLGLIAKFISYKQ